MEKRVEFAVGRAALPPWVHPPVFEQGQLPYGLGNNTDAGEIGNAIHSGIGAHMDAGSGGAPEKSFIKTLSRVLEGIPALY
jgi:hypothetical protein